CSATNVDAAATHHRPVTVVDPLMAVADEEQVVRPRGNHRPQQLQGLGTEVLGLVYNDRRIVRPTLRIGLDHLGYLAVGIVHLLEPPRGKLPSVFLENGPDRVTHGTRQYHPAANAPDGPVLVQRRDPLSKHDLFQ